MSSLIMSEKALRLRPNEDLGKTSSIFPSIEAKARDQNRHNTSFVPITSKKKGIASAEDLGSFKFTGSLSNQITYRELKELLENQQRDIEERNEMITHLQKNFENLKLQHIREKNEGLELSKNIQSLRDLNGQLSNKVKLQSQKIDEYRAKLEKYEKEAGEKKEFTRKSSLKTSEGVSTPPVRLPEAKTLLESLRGELLAKEKLLSESNATLESKRGKCKAYKKRCQDVEFLLKDSKVEIDHLKKSIANHNSEKAALNQILNDTVRKWEETVKSQNKDIEALNAENLQLKAKFSNEKDLTLKIERMKTEINALQAIMMSQEREIEIYRDRDKENNEIREEQERLQRQLRAKEREIDEYETVVSGLKRKIESLSKAPSGSVKLNNIDSEIKYLKEKIDLKIQNLPMGADKDRRSFDRPPDKAERNIKENIEKLDKAEKEITTSVKCLFCRDFLKLPVTCIPCGHSYCQGCSQAYNSVCYKCGSNHRVDAVYRNELLDDLLRILKTIQDLSQNLKK